MIPAETLERLRRELGVRADALTPAELQALTTADVEGSVSNARLQELLTDHPVDITRMLARLCERGLLVSDYRLGGGLQKPLPFETGDSGHLAGDSGHLSEEELGRLRAMAAPVAESGKAGSGEQVISIISALCGGRYLTAPQLTDLLNRSAEGLRKRYLSPMVRDGRLRLRYPQAPNRPDQAYIAAKRNP